MTPTTQKQYQREERTMISNRIKVAHLRVEAIIQAMKQDTLSTPENVNTLKTELASFYEYPLFHQCQSMGDLVELSLKMLFEKPDLYKDD
jgi:hypothetical protein